MGRPSRDVLLRCKTMLDVSKKRENNRPLVTNNGISEVGRLLYHGVCWQVQQQCILCRLR